MASPVLEIIVNDRQLRKLYKQYPIQIDNAFKRILSDGSIIVQKELRDTAPVGVTQNLARNVQRTVSKYQARIRPLASYTYWVEYGRSAGKMPPWSGSEGEDFRKWVALKLGSEVPPFVVARAIGKKVLRRNHLYSQPIKNRAYGYTLCCKKVNRIVGLLNA